MSETQKVLEVRLNKALILGTAGNVYDEELHSLRRALTVLDGELDRLDIEIRAAGQEVPQMEEADYLAGLGFVACQRYIISIAALHKGSRRSWSEVGQRLTYGATAVSLINAAANLWKHEPEWELELDRRQALTEERFWANLDARSGDYKFVNALHALNTLKCPPSHRHFAGVIELLVAWRNEFLATSPTYGCLFGGMDNG